MEEIFKRVWDNLIARASGPMNFRLIIQPAVASLLAILAGLKDAREGDQLSCGPPSQTAHIDLSCSDKAATT